jgi:hypothetical protein
MLFKDLGSKKIENLKFRDAWFMIKSILNKDSKSTVNVYAEEVD